MSINKLIVIHNSHENLAMMLNVELTNITVEGYKDVYEFKKVSATRPIRADLMLVFDEGLNDTELNTRPISKGVNELIYILKTSSLVDIGKIIFLNKEINTNHLEYMKYAASIKEIRAQKMVYSKDSYSSADLKSIIITDEKEYKDSEIEEVNVIRKLRSEQAVSEFIKSSTTDKVTTVRRKTSNDNISEIQNNTNLLYGKNKLTSSEESELEEIVFESISNSYLNKLSKKSKGVSDYIVLTGTSGSGLTTSTLIIANTLSKKFRVLVVDLNPLNNGLANTLSACFDQKDYLILDMSKQMSEKNINGYLEECHYNPSKLKLFTFREKPDIRLVNNLFVRLMPRFETEFDYIIVEVPTQNLMGHMQITNKAEKIIFTSAPYRDNIESLINSIKGDNLITVEPFQKNIINPESDNIILMRNDLYNAPEEILPLQSQIIINMFKNKHNLIPKITGIYTNNGFLDPNFVEEVLR